MANGKREVIGFAEFGAYEKRNNGSGEVEYEAVSSVNKKLKIEPSDEVRQIVKKRFEITEVEEKDIDGDTFYKKNVKAKQTDSGDSDVGTKSSSSGRSGGAPSNYGSDPSEQSNSNEPSGLFVLKNFVDKVNDRVGVHDIMLWITMACIGIIAGYLLLR
jgi:hypothetical protein